MTTQQIKDLQSVWFNIHKQIEVIERIGREEIAEGDKEHEDGYPIDHCGDGYDLLDIAKNITRYVEKLDDLTIKAERQTKIKIA